MASTTIEQFAAELGMPVCTLLEQLRNAGVSGKKEDDALSDADKTRLLDYLRKQHGADGAPGRVITLIRKSTTAIKKTASTGEPRTIRIEIRRKIVIVTHDEAESVSTVEKDPNSVVTPKARFRPRR